MRPPTLLRSDRLWLRASTLADAEATLKNYAQDPAVTRYLPWRPHPGIETTQAILQRFEKSWQDGTAFPFGIALSEGGEVIGCIELRPKGESAELGYVLGQAYWGRGIMTEALKAVLDWALGPGGFRRAEATCDGENLASVRVMEKAGMERQGLRPKHTLHPNLSPEPRDAWAFVKHAPSE